MEILSFASIVALSVKFTDFLKYLTNKDRNALITQLTVWVSGVAAVVLARLADITAGIEVPGTGASFGSLDVWSAVFVGLGLSSAGSFLYDFKKSRDNLDSSWTPSLVPGSHEGPPISGP